MSDYAYIAVSPEGSEARGVLAAVDQNEALKRIKEMGLFPTKLGPAKRLSTNPPTETWWRTVAGGLHSLATIRLPSRVKTGHLSVFTRQLATLVEAGMPLLRGLRILEEQEENYSFKQILGKVAASIEEGATLTEALRAYPKVFNGLFINMVRAGEIGGALEITLKRLAEFMEKSQKIRGKVKAAMFYPCAVMLVATGIVTLLLVFVLPRFKMVFNDMLNGQPLPAFTRFVFGISEGIAHRAPLVAVGTAVLVVLLVLALRTTWGRWTFDQIKISVPVLGPLFRKLAISRFSRTLGTLMANGVPILQSLTIVKETTGNVILGRLITDVHENVKQGEPIAPTLKGSSLFPAMVAGMVDVGEQTGALPDMLMKVADVYDEEVDNAAGALTSLLEPIMIVMLAVVVGSIVIAMFLPLIGIINGGINVNNHGVPDDL
jgi:type IV pilus assembly protein PilC